MEKITFYNEEVIKLKINKRIPKNTENLMLNNINIAKDNMVKELIAYIITNGYITSKEKDWSDCIDLSLQILLINPMKIKIIFIGINSNGNKCYVTEQGSYIADINGELYALNQYPEEGYIGIEGEPDFKVDKNKLEIVEEF